MVEDHLRLGKQPFPIGGSPPQSGIDRRRRTVSHSGAAVAATNDKHIILRTSWVYAPFGNNFVRTMLRLSKQRSKLTVVNDQIGCPTFAPDLALAIFEIAHKVLSKSSWDKDLAGITHICGPDEVSWYEFACKIMHFSQLKCGHSVEVEPIPSSAYPTAAVRPANSC